MPTLNTHLTPHGYETLMTKGLVNTTKYYKLIDQPHNYTVKAKENFIFPVTGKHKEITSSHCSYSNYEGVFMTEPSRDEIIAITSKVEIDLVNQDCDYNFNQPNIILDINLHSWMYELQNLTYNLNMPGLSKDLWDYVTAKVQSLNLSTNTYEDILYTADLGISWVPDTETDKRNLLLVSPTYTHIKGSIRELIDNRGSIRNGSPFLLPFYTNTINGKNVNNTGAKIALVPNKVGYWVNNSEFLTASVVENSDLNGYKSVYPAAAIGSSIYYLPTKVAYPTEEGFVGYAMNMIKVNGSETMITGFINQMISFAKTYFTADNAGVYNMQINLHALVTNKNINYIPNKFGGKVTLNFRFDPSNINNNEEIIKIKN